MGVPSAQVTVRVACSGVPTTFAITPEQGSPPRRTPWGACTSGRSKVALISAARGAMTFWISASSGMLALMGRTAAPVPGGCAARCRHSREARSRLEGWNFTCLLYTSDAADEEDSVDLGGRR